jgi:DNA (cytosine-5)-methyltransferase 1
MSWNFVDLFSGIGGFHQGCMKAAKTSGTKAVCIAACDIDEGARNIYHANYGVLPHPDIRTLKPISGIDLVCAGFPCQSHSSLGLRKGLRDPRGRLFNDLCSFIQRSKPKAFLLENVKGILANTSFPNMIKKLEEFGYSVSWFVLDSSDFGLPQHRERVYIVGIRGTVSFDVDTVKSRSRPVIIKDIIDPAASKDPSLAFHIFDNTPLFDPPVATDTGFLLRAKLSNFTNRKLFSSYGLLGTIATASPPPIYDEDAKRIRHLSKKELLKCQGFPANFKFPTGSSRSFAVHYIGNAVSVNTIAAIVTAILKVVS